MRRPIVDLEEPPVTEGSREYQLAFLGTRPRQPRPDFRSAVLQLFGAPRYNFSEYL